VSDENFIKWVCKKDYEANELKVKELRHITGCDWAPSLGGFRVRGAR